MDAGNRLLEITLNSNDISRYCYDADGFRVKKEMNSTGMYYSGARYYDPIIERFRVK